MYSITKDWNPKQTKLKDIIRKPGFFDESRNLFLELHSMVHLSVVSGMVKNTFADEVISGITYDKMSSDGGTRYSTIAYNLWHITRIEDITVNMLVNNSNQIFNNEWLVKLNCSLTHTGNSLNVDERIKFSSGINKKALIDYRNSVGKQTQDILKNLTFSDMKRKVRSESIDRILKAGGVTEHPDSIWLLDLWAKKDVAGIILLPVTRHQSVHLNDCLKIRTKLKI